MGAMSRENVEVVRKLYDLGAGNLEAGLGLELFDPDIEWLPASQSVLSASSYRGHAGVRDFWNELMSAWEEYLVEPQEFLDLGDQVVVVQRIRARSQRGLEISEVWSSLFTLRDGVIVRFRGFTDRDGALAAASPRERGGSRPR